MVSDTTVPRKDGASLGFEAHSMSSPEFGRHVIDKISRHLLWFLFLLFVFSFLDRINIGFAGLTMVGDPSPPAFSTDRLLSVLGGETIGPVPPDDEPAMLDADVQRELRGSSATGRRDYFSPRLFVISRGRACVQSRRSALIPRILPPDVRSRDA